MEIQDKLERWIRSDFEQRMHNLIYLDKEKSFRSAFMCFDPIIYLISSNRTIFRLYSYLKSEGFPIQESNPPQDPYKVQHAITFAFRIGIVFTTLLFGGTFLWSILIAHSNFAWTSLSIILSLSVLILPNLWNYLATIRKWGYPSSEPIGAYIVGFVPNKLSLIGW